MKSYSKVYIKSISFLVAVAVLLSLIFVLPVSAESSVGYFVSGSVSGSDFTVNVSIENVKAYSGRFALAFDTEMLELADDSSLTSAINRSPNVVVTPEGHDSSVLVSNSGGYAMFAWYVSANSALDASGSPELVATIPFKIKSGYSADDFTRNTIGIRYMNSSMLQNWDCGASIIERSLNKYSINAVNEDYLCNITFDYPNCDVIPIVYYDASFSVVDLSGNPLRGAEVRIDDMRTTTDSSGRASFQLASGTYGYRVQILGYQTQSGYITVEGGDVNKSILLRSYAQMVQVTASELEIEFSMGDDAANVTTGIGLPGNGPNGETITWESSNPSVVTNQGIVVRQESDVNVTLTATVSLGTASTMRTFYITVRSKSTTEMTNETIVSLDAEELQIGFAPGDSAESVTADITLPEYGSYGSGIIWSISHADILDDYGTVTRPSVDTTVRATAKIIRGSASREKVFTLYVKAAAAGKSDADLVNDVYNVLQIGYAAGDSASSVTKSLTLPVNGADGVEIIWTSSQPAIVTSYGGVTCQHSDCQVTLTANIVKGSASRQKQFTITVKAAEVPPDKPGNDNTKTDAEIAAADKNSLSITYAPGDSSGSVSANLTLPAIGENGSSIFWESSNPGVIDSYGTVTRPTSDTNVTLTAIISKGNATERASFNVTVKGSASSGSQSDSDAVNRVAEALEVVYAKGDSAGRVTKSVTLPTEGADGTKISWQSSNTNVIGTNGGVTRKTSDMTVTLTATVTRGTASASKTFTLTVIAASELSGSSMVGGGGGGAGDPGMNTDPNQPISPSAQPQATAAPVSNERFVDLGNVPWARDAILTLAEKGVIKGTSDTTFSPDSAISRGDYVTLLVRLLGLSTDLGDGFEDVPEDSYYYETITTAKTLGVIDGIGDNMFDPESAISRQDMMTMTYRALSRLDLTADWQPSELEEFNDVWDISDYALESVQYVVGGGLIAGDENGYINPLSDTTRAETAVFLNRLDAQI